MHKFSTATTKSSGVRCAPPVLRSVGLLNVPYSTFAGVDPHRRVPLARLVRSALSSLRDKNLCIVRAKTFFLVSLLCGVISGPSSVLMGQSADSVEDLVTMKLTVDVRVFTVMAALNAAGFDYETPGKTMSELRQEIRQELQQTDPGLLERLQAFYQEHRQGSHGIDNQVSYVSLALLLSAPPEFKLIFEDKNIPADARRLLGFESLVQEFYQKAGIQSMWERYQSAYAEELEIYRPVLKGMIEQTPGIFSHSAKICTGSTDCPHSRSPECQEHRQRAQSGTDLLHRSGTHR